jgi:DNA-binding GntR family transcriptional regulator
MSNMVFTQSERYRRHTVEYNRLLPAAQEEHHAIMSAAINRDAEEASRLLTEHIVLGVEKVRLAMVRDLKREARAAGRARKR